MSTAPSGFQNPKTTWQAADIPLSDDFKRIEGNAQATELGNRTVDQAQAPSGNVGTLRQFLDWFANRIKAILGTTNWYSAPPITLTTAKAKADILDAHVGIGGSTHPEATTTTAGFMSATDKQRLDNAPMTDTEILNAVKRVDGPGSGLDADIWGGLKWVKPGTGITFFERLEEVSGRTSQTLEIANLIIVRPGMYRLSGELKTENSSPVTISMYKPFWVTSAFGDSQSLLPSFQTTSAEYVSFSLDMTAPVFSGDFVVIRVTKSNDYWGYCRNIRLRAVDGLPGFENIYNIL
jgi:hypothetical protein